MKMQQNDHLEISWLSNVCAVTGNVDDFINYTRTFYHAQDPVKLI